MNSQLDNSRSISDQQWRELNARGNCRSAVRFGLQYAALLGSAGFLVTSGHTGSWALVLALATFSLMVAAMYSACHETIHGTAFRTRWLNRCVLWLAAVPIMYTPTGQQQYHFAHHRNTQVPGKDPEIAPFGIPQPSATSNIVAYGIWMTGLCIPLYKIGVLLAGSVGRPEFLWRHYLYYIPSRYRKRFCLEARLVLGLHATSVAVGVTVLPGILWLYLGQLLGHFLVTAQTSGDHQGLPESGEILDRTRTVKTSPLINFVFWNMPYHAEHHAYPSVPWHALPRLHDLLEAKLRHQWSGYIGFHRHVLGQFFGRWRQPTS